MGSTNKTSLGLNQWVASDKPVRQDFVTDNSIIDDSLSKLNRDLATLSREAVTARMRADKPANAMTGANNKVEFFIVSDSWGTTANNFPSNSAGVLMNMNLYDTHWIQTFFSLNNANIYIRRYQDTLGWTAWKMVA